MIAFAVQFLIFVIVVVIIALTLQWGLAKLGVAIDPTLKTILGLLIFLVCLLIFLNFSGVWVWNTHR